MVRRIYGTIYRASLSLSDFPQRNILWLLLVSVVLLILGGTMISQAPSAHYLRSLTITQNDGNPIVVGYRELGQHGGAGSADKAHLQIQYDQQKGWLFQNISANKLIDARTSRLHTRYLRRLALKVGDQLKGEGFMLTVQSIEPLVVTASNISHNSRTVQATWSNEEKTLKMGDGRYLHSNCDSTAAIKSALRKLLSPLRTAEKEVRLFSFGGLIDCTNRFKWLDTDTDTLRFYQMDNRYWVGPGTSGKRVLIVRNDQTSSLRSQALVGEGSDDGRLERFVIGRTHYTLDQNFSAHAKEFSLIPTANRQLHSRLPEELDELTKTVTLSGAGGGKFPRWSQQAVWAGDIAIGKVIGISHLVITFMVFALFLGLRYFGRREIIERSFRRRVVLQFAFYGSAMLLLVSMLLAYSVWVTLGQLLLMWVVINAWTILVIWKSGRLTPSFVKLWSVYLALSGAGLLTLSQLALGADNTRWLNFPMEAAFWLTQVSGWAALLALSPLGSIFRLIRRFSSLNQGYHRITDWKGLWPILVWGSILVAVLGIQAVWGSEGGVAGIQPVEFIKLMFVVLSVQVILSVQNMRSVQASGFRQNYLRVLAEKVIAWSVPVLCGISVLMLGVSDYSPVVIMACMSLAMLWLVSRDPVRSKSKSERFWSFSIGAVLLSLVVLGVSLYLSPPEVDSVIPQPERLRIWSNPLLYPDSGFQLLRSLEYSGQGGWLGHGWFGANNQIMNLPAVQDDFIGAYFLNRFGLLAGLVLLTLQALWLMMLFSLSHRLTTISASSDAKLVLRFIAYVLYGMAWLSLLHWLISWSNVLGWLPIMGQPMTWMSAGNSHLLAIGMPGLLLALLGVWSVDAQSR